MFFHRNYQKEIKNNLINISKINNCSFEFFPPKSLILEEKLWSSVDKLSQLKPLFFSVTYGANSGERKKTYNIVKEIYNRTGIVSAPHLTCVDSTSAELHKIGEQYWNSGITSIVALRGDAPKKKYIHQMYALDLVRILKKIADFDISVAAYPEMHPESKSVIEDIIYLKKKMDAGANRAITQFFFNIDSYLYFRDRCVKNGINIEIVPGILPISNFQQIQRFSSLTNVHIPTWIFNMFQGLEHDTSTQEVIGNTIAIDIVQKLLYEGVKSFHFYTLNKANIVYAICRMLRI